MATTTVGTHRSIICDCRKTPLALLPYTMATYSEVNSEYIKKGLWEQLEDVNNYITMQTIIDHIFTCLISFEACLMSHKVKNNT